LAEGAEKFLFGLEAGFDGLVQGGEVAHMVLFAPEHDAHAVAAGFFVQIDAAHSAAVLGLGGAGFELGQLGAGLIAGVGAGLPGGVDPRAGLAHTLRGVGQHVGGLIDDLAAVAAALPQRGTAGAAGGCTVAAPQHRQPPYALARQIHPLGAAAACRVAAL